MRTRPGIGGHRQEHSFYYPSSSPASSPFEMRYLDSQLEYPTSAMTLATASTAQTYAIALFSLLIMVLIVKFQRDNATLQTDSSVPKTHSQGILPSATVTDDESKKRRQHFVQVYCRTKKALQDLPYLARYASVNQMVAYCLNKPIPTLDECSFEEPMTVLAQAVETPTLTIPAIVLWSPIASSKEQHEDAVRFPYSSSRTQDAALLRPNEQYCPRSPVEKTARPMVVFKRRFSSLRMSRQISAPLPASPSPVVPDLPTDVELSRCSSGSQSTELLDSPLDVQSREPFCGAPPKYRDSLPLPSTETSVSPRRRTSVSTQRQSFPMDSPKPKPTARMPADLQEQSALATFAFLRLQTSLATSHTLSSRVQAHAHDWAQPTEQLCAAF